MKKNKIIVAITTLGIMSTCFILKQSNISTAFAIDYHLQKNSRLRVETVTSSSPYDYIDQQCYDRIVKLGMPAVEILEKKYETGELGGFDAYIAALAIQEITGCNMHDVTGEDYGTAEEFFAHWKKMVNKLPDEFQEIVNRDLDEEEKIQELKKYGVFGESYISAVNERDKEIIQYFGVEIDGSKLKADVNREYSEKDIAVIDEYLALKISPVTLR